MSHSSDETPERHVGEYAHASGRIVVLTGAGISAESGIPTFRGQEGYWKIGSRNYHPQEMATFEAFQRMPDEVWAWYLYRRSVCRAAAPNAAHEALVRMERRLGERFQLITQNVDGLHLRAGQSAERTWQIHGNIDYMRCANGCDAAIHPLPAALGDRFGKMDKVDDRLRGLLVCPSCGGGARPHVLWFDEMYDEARYHFESSMNAMTGADALIVIGTSGATTLPTLLVQASIRSGIALLVVDPGDNIFTAAAESAPSGLHARGSATELVPRIATELGAEMA
jgi:NAD-dependent deacetylase